MPAFLRARTFLAIVALLLGTGFLVDCTTAAITTTGLVSPSPPRYGDQILVGYNGYGTLLIDGGFQFHSSFARIGENNVGFGIATVTGSGSYWLINNAAIGNGGVGRLEIRDGGIVEVQSGQLQVGNSTFGNGTIVVEGAGSLLNLNSSLGLAANGGIASLEISSGAMVNFGQSYGVEVGSGGKIQLLGGSLRAAGINNGGIIRGSGEIVGGTNNSNENRGRIEVAVGDRLSIGMGSGGMFTNLGELAVRGGELELSTVHNNVQGDAEGMITLQNGVLRAGLVGSNSGEPQLVNRSLIAAVDGESHVHGHVRNEQNGTITVTNESLAIFHNRVDSIHESTISVYPGSTAIFLDDLVMNGGTLLADLVGATDFGHVEVVGDLYLDGVLQVDFGDQYAPQAGDSFSLMSVAGGITGGLSVSALSALPSELDLQVAVESHSVVLNVVLAGDYNIDGSVDAADYTVWRDALESGNLAADGNNDGSVDSGDFDVWKAHFGATSGGSSTTLAVPEPGIGLLLLAILGMTAIAGRLPIR